MKKAYLSPQVTCFVLVGNDNLMSVSGNNITGTIHTGTGDEHIGVGNEDDEEGLEASAKGFWSEMD